MNLQEYREFRGISVQQVSKELGISRQHIYDIEKRLSFPSRKLCKKINIWSGGFITRGELLFPDEATSKNDNLITVKNWEEKRKRDRTDNLHETRIIGNETYAGI
jgi:transcriptional regulator with XRE-family HTH domain